MLSLPPTVRVFVAVEPFDMLAFDGKVLGAVTRLFVDSILGWYHRRLRKCTLERAQSGAVVAVQRASSDLKLNPHLHAVFLDGVYAAGSDAISSSERWAELLKRTFGIDVETCPRCGGRMQLLAVITDLASAARFLRHRGEPSEPPTRAPARDPPYWQSKVVRRHGQSVQPSQLEMFEER